MFAQTISPLTFDFFSGPIVETPAPGTPSSADCSSSDSGFSHTSEALEAENAALHSACLGLLELLKNDITHYPSVSTPALCAIPTSVEAPIFAFPGACPKTSEPNIVSCYGRRKNYGAPPGVWRNPYGFVSTVYVNKKRVYGPLRKTIEDASRDREAMVQAKEFVTTVEDMRAFVRDYLKPNPHGGVVDSVQIGGGSTLGDDFLVTI